MNRQQIEPIELVHKSLNNQHANKYKWHATRQGNGAYPAPGTPKTKDSFSIGAHRRLEQETTNTAQQEC